MFVASMVSSPDQAVADMANVNRGIALNINNRLQVSYAKWQENAERVYGK